MQMSPQWAFVGSLTSLGKSNGISVLELSDGRLGRLVHETTIENPTFLATSPRHNALFAASHCSTVGGVAGGAVTSFSIDPATGTLTPTRTEHGVSPHPAYISVDPSESWVLTASTMGGAVSVFPITEEGTIGPCAQIVQHAGEQMEPWPPVLSEVRPTPGAPMAHSVVFNPRGDHIAVADLGLNQLRVLPWNATTGRIEVDRARVADAPTGAGPRHVAWHPTRPLIYVAHERDSTVGVYDAGAGASIRLTQSVPSTETTSPGVVNKPAEIRIDRSGRFVYVSTRGVDTVATFAVDERSGQLTFVREDASGIHEPRGMSLVPDGTNLLVANQNGDSIATYTVDATSGAATFDGHLTPVPSPTCIAFLGAASR